MQRLLLVLVIAIAVAASYLYLDQQDKEVSNASNPASIPPAEQTQAREHINRLTQGSNQPIEISKADNFVTADQLLKLPENKIETAAALVTETQAELQESPPEQLTSTIAVNPLGNVIGGAKEKRIVTDTVTQPLVMSGQIKLQELLDDPDQSAQKVYFIHAVNEGDDEGLWGIIQHGLMRTFTSGLSLPGLDKTVYVDIPKEADERLEDKRSSFLGQVLKNKVDQTYIYNYQKGILGDNPDLIQPGQQLVIVTFTEQELIGIYHHFVNL